MTIRATTFAAVLALALATAGSALAQTSPAADTQATTPRPTHSAYVHGSLNLAAGERVVLKQEADGSFTFVGAQFVGLDAALPPQPGQRADLATLNRAEPGTIAISLGARRDAGSFLKIENGLDKNLKYIGFVVRFVGGQARGPARTSVCTVMAGKLGFEHWNEPVIQMVMANLSTVEGEAAICESHDVNQ